MRWQTYVCPLCKSTKTIHAHPSQPTSEFEQGLPVELPCGWRGCTGMMKP